MGGAERAAGAREYRGISEVLGPLVSVRGAGSVGFNELAEVRGADGETRLGLVLETSDELAALQIFEGTMGLTIPDTRVRFRGRPLELSVSREMLGRVFDGIGRPRDGGPEPIGGTLLDVNGLPINPTAREYPKRFSQTGISAIDGMNTLIRGQKLPIFSGSGLPHNRLAAQIARQARILGEETRFAVVFAAMGIKYDTARFFTDSFEESGALENAALFLNLADDPPVERLITPRAALTLAEHLAFDEGMHVLVVLTDVSNYCESLREIATVRGDIPSRKGYPGYLYSDLASIYERAGMVRGIPGSITQIPILTMPNDDITHPIPDLTGFITEGQIVLDRDLFGRGIYPPVAGLPSLSRLMKDGIGEGITRADHAHLAGQLFEAYSHVKDLRALASVIGEEELSPLDTAYLAFGREFEGSFLRQGEHEDRPIERTLDLGWQMLRLLPREELHRMTDEEMERHYPR
ncbi:MAG: V-type ATP synthase subunit B [Candidatus Aureabacteria bacterium]|nr:V-type ATP synthase subunit B [Candidatus Auribacterota bacterium]